MKRNGTFIEGPILGPLLRFTLPVLLALLLLLQAMYGAVDLIVVGQFGQPAGVSAVSTGSQVMHTVTALVTGLSMGAMFRELGVSKTPLRTVTIACVVNIAGDLLFLGFYAVTALRDRREAPAGRA